MPQVSGKTIVACVLVLTLLFMWIKVFIGGSEDAQEPVGSVLGVKSAMAANVSGALKLKYHSLEYLPGRHDRLTTDMFTSRGLEVENNSSESSKEGEDRRRKMKSQKDVALKLAGILKVDAIIMGTNDSGHQVFINGEIQVVGDELSVKLNEEVYEIKVVEIFHNKVVLKWSDYTISVRMAELD